MFGAGEGGVLGEPVKIADVARSLVAQAARPVQIVYTGLRPGEKLHEVLLAAEELDDRPVHPLIAHVPVPALEPSTVLALDLDLPPDVLTARLRHVGLYRHDSLRLLKSP